MIDPLIVMDELGTDALRFTLLVGSTPGNDMNLSREEGGSQPQLRQQDLECGRFVISAISCSARHPSESGRGAGIVDWTLADSWIWARLQQLIRDVERLFQTFQYGEAGRQIYEFFWSDFADWYVEIAKQQMQSEETTGTDHPHAGTCARYVSAPAASVHALRHRRAVGAPAKVGARVPHSGYWPPIGRRC